MSEGGRFRATFNRMRPELRAGFARSAGVREALPPKELELPPAAARRFVQDMLAFFKETNQIKQDEIAARQLHALRQHYAGKLRLVDVTQMFVEMKDHA